LSFEFKPDESLQQQLHHLVASDVDDAVALLLHRASPRTSHDKAVHESRKMFKRQRALLRLVRDAIPDRDFRRANHAFRDAGRALSAVRDAKVLVDAFDKLLEHFKSELVPDAFSPIRRKLLQKRRAAKEHGPMTLHQVADLLRKQKRQAQSLKLKHSGWKAIAPGLQQIYRQGRDAIGEALDHPTFESLHEWRKRVKDLWHQTQLLEPAWPEQLKQYGDDLHALSDLLGDDHDLAVLRQTIAESPNRFGQPAQIDPLFHLIDTRRSELEIDAFTLGQRLFAEKPRQFVDRIHSYWQAWQHHDTAAPQTPGMALPGPTAH
jgi:CHAD domain-containing protein